MKTIHRQAYMEMYGPTVGDRVRLADTELIIQVEEDRTVYGERLNSAEGRPSATAWDKASTRKRMWRIR